MASSYDKYLARKRQQLNTNPYVSSANRQAQIIGGNLVNLENQFARSLRRQDAPLTAQTEALKTAQLSEAKLLSNIYQKSTEADMQRRQAINTDIERAELAREEELRQKRLQEKEQKNELWKVGGQVLGGAVGFMAGGVPGAMAGTQIGGGLAETGIGLAGGANSKQRLISGIQNMTAGALSTSNIVSQRNFIQESGNFFSSDNYLGLTPEQKEQILIPYQQAIMTGDFNIFRNAMKNYLQQPQQVVPLPNYKQVDYMSEIG